MGREEILSALKEAYAARVSEDADALARLWTATTTFEIEGDKALLEAFPGAGAMGMERATDILIALVKMTDARQEVIAIEGNRAVVLNHATLSFGGGEPFTTTMCDVWEFDDAGKVRSLREFLDTAMLASEMAGMR